MSRILIVDDHADNRYMLRALLSGHDHDVDEARHGAEALSMARAHRPDLAVVDLLMPVMDGYSLLRHWKSDPDLRGIPVLVYTATYTGPKDERLARDLGADDFLIKPAEPDAMMARISSLLDSAGDGPRPPQGDPEALLAAYGDVLVRKLEEKAMQLERANAELHEQIATRRRSEETLLLRDRAIQAVSQGIVICDARQDDLPIIYAGAGFERITGYAPAEAIGRNCRFLQGDGTDSATVAELRAAIAARRPCSATILNHRKDGSPFWNELSITPVLDEHGEATHFVGVQNDVTARRDLEGRLRQTQKLEAIGQLAGGVAHDFNNLLTVIAGHGDIMVRRLPLGDPLRRQAQAICDASARAAALTRQLLTFSRRSVPDLRVLELNTVVRETDTMLRRLIDEDIALETTLDERIGRVRADPDQLGQTLLNLVVNARDAMPRGGRISIATTTAHIDASYASTRTDARPGAYVRLSVSDTGEGMTAEVRARIFEPFFTTKPVGKGTGLGLAVVHGIVRQCGGFIEVYSEPGRGTSFSLYLPAVTEDASSPRQRPDGPVPDGTETILLAEDESDVRILATAALEGHGYTVIPAPDASSALTAAANRDWRFDLLLTDVVMPGMGGGELWTHVRNRNPSAKVLFMSGYTEDAVVRHDVLEEQVAFLHKPFSLDDLARTVRSVLDGGPPPSSAPTPR